MIIKKALVAVLAIMLFTAPGCAINSGGKETGFAYILARGSGHTNVQTEKTTPAVPRQVPVKPSQVVPQVDRTVYLTFDDGPDFINTPMVLDTLDNYGVKATFFVLGTSIQKNPQILKDIVKRGHAVGNHTFDHKYASVYGSAYGFVNEFSKNQSLIYQVAGIQPTVARDPGGEARNSTVLKQRLAQNGLKLIDWNVDSYDSRQPALDGVEIVENVRRQVMGKKLGSEIIVLMHDGQGHMNTVRALPTIIEMLKSQGFNFGTLK